ncbi:hypothetical protein PSY47_23695, partial [Shigella flexneri]|nr:hypothetical protein [Shigella flexneri]
DLEFLFSADLLQHLSLASKLLWRMIVCTLLGLLGLHATASETMVVFSIWDVLHSVSFLL